MISLKAFVTAIHDAVLSASDALMNKNYEQFSKYFIEDDVLEDENIPETKSKAGRLLTPKMVQLHVPLAEEVGNNGPTNIMVPLITLVPFSSCQIEKVTLTTDFQMSIDKNNELQLDFSNTRRWGNKHHNGKLEIVVTPTDAPNGLQQIIEGYESMLKKQI